MNSLENNLSIYMPPYLSQASKISLIESLKQFPDNIGDNLYMKDRDYAKIAEGHILQGDGIDKFDFFDISSKHAYQGPAIVLSNTCDMDMDNHRRSAINVCCLPIFKFDKFSENLRKIESDTRSLENYFSSLRQQQVSHCFYLPKGPALQYEGIVFFDKIMSYENNNEFSKTIKQNRFFSLSQYGFYLFLFKLSFHFTRIAEGIDRNAGHI